MKYPVYLDNNATTPIDPRVLDAMLPSMREHFGNPASNSHEYGWYAEELVQMAREQVSNLLGSRFQEIVFTSGATESINLALQGVIRRARDLQNSRRPHVISAATEHKATLDTLLFFFDRKEIELTLLPLDELGQIRLSDFQAAIRPNTVLVSLMLANNEIGTLHDISRLSQETRKREILFHCDATQGLGKLEVDVNVLGVDLLSLSAHKISGPKGIGALYLREDSTRGRLSPLLFGGGQEHGLRSGTLPVPNIVGLGAASKIAKESREELSAHLRRLSEQFFSGLQRLSDSILLNGPALENRLPGNINAAFPRMTASRMLSHMRGKVACSASSACSSDTGRPSHVLQAIGLSTERIQSSLRLGFGRINSEEDVEKALSAFEASLNA